MRYPGTTVDLGDVSLHLGVTIKAHRLPLDFGWHVSAPRDTTAADRVATLPSTTPLPPTRKADVHMDLQADKKVTLSGTFTDEVGNTVPLPDGATVTYTVSDPAVITLTDNGDGSAVAAATGQLGTANVHGEANLNGRITTGDIAFVVVPGDAERFTIVPGEPEEVTPDEGNAGGGNA